ncbi:hypothetical protein NP493_369g01013 [Ridgeia piscesae]|uniref:Uncharacterized protein n=1 Tax=Ridgeia piscesae TaxID=27915 RepID=A0AAD9NV89_RIDPI|nr:hypothetical protein NP493_369g01013 [Ridgeia piscesae]
MFWFCRRNRTDRQPPFCSSLHQCSSCLFVRYLPCRPRHSSGITKTPTGSRWCSDHKNPKATLGDCPGGVGEGG